MTPPSFTSSGAARVERVARSGGLSLVAVGPESGAMSTPHPSRAQQFARRRRAVQRLTMRCSEPGGSVVVAIVASRAPGR